MADAQPKRPNSAFRRWREEERRESRDELARAIAEAALRLGERLACDARLIEKWEKGSVRCPQYAYQRVLTSLAGRSMVELGFASRERLLTARSDSAAEFPIMPAPPLDAPLVTHGIDVEQLRHGLNDVLNHGAMAEASLDQWEQTPVRYGIAARTVSSVALLRELAADLEELKNVLQRRRSASSVRRLTRVSAQLSGLVCLTLIKLGEQSAFHRWARTARIAAEEADDPATKAWVLSQEAYGHFYWGDLTEAVSVAQHAQAVSGRLVCPGVPLASAIEARAHALLGRGESSRAAIRKTESATFALTDGDRSVSALGYNEAQLRFHEGNVYTHLGDSQLALEAHERALSLCTPGDYTDLALIRFDRASCLASTGDAESAVSELTSSLLELTETQRRGILNARAFEVIRKLPAGSRSLPAMRDLEDLLTPVTYETKGIQNGYS